MKTGFKDLDELVNFVPGDVVVIGARPGMGKSAFLRQMGMNFALDGKTVGVWDFQRGFSERRDIVKRQLSFQGNDQKTSDLLFKNYQFLQEQDFQSLSEWLSKNEDNSSLDVLIVDFIQLDLFGSNLGRELTNRMNHLKKFAIKTNCVVFVASQLSREVERIQGHRPMLIHLSESSSLEEVADIVLFILRREYYDPLDKPGMAELIAEKNSRRSPSSINLLFNKEKMIFSDYIPVQHINNCPETEEAFSDFNPD